MVRPTRRGRLLLIDRTAPATASLGTTGTAPASFGAKAPHYEQLEPHQPVSGLKPLTNIYGMEGSEGFNLFGDPDELRERLGDLANQMLDSQRVAWADNAIKLAVDMTVAAINRLDLAGGSDEQAVQVRDAIRIVFPEAVTLVREAREGLA